MPTRDFFIPASWSSYSVISLNPNCFLLASTLQISCGATFLSFGSRWEEEIIEGRYGTQILPFSRWGYRTTGILAICVLYVFRSQSCVKLILQQLLCMREERVREWLAGLSKDPITSESMNVGKYKFFGNHSTSNLFLVRNKSECTAVYSYIAK